MGRTEGLTPLDVQATFSLPADPPGVAGQWKQLDLTFLPGAFASGDLLSFGVDRDETDVAGPGGAAGGNSADLLGGGVLIPSGKLVPGGASFFGKFEGGFSFRGEFFNLIGHGYSQLDGYGFINAEAAVKAVQRRSEDDRRLIVLSRGPALATVRALSFSGDPSRNSCVTTHMNKALWRVALLAVLLLSGLLACTKAPAAQDTDRVALEAAIHRWMTAVNAQDVDTLTRTMTEDVELLDANARR